MKITNTLPTGSITFSTADGPVTVRAGETSADLKIKADDLHVSAHRTAGNITLSGRGAPRDEEPVEAVEADTPNSSISAD